MSGCNNSTDIQTILENKNVVEYAIPNDSKYVSTYESAMVVSEAFVNMSRMNEAVVSFTSYDTTCLESSGAAAYSGYFETTSYSITGKITMYSNDVVTVDYSNDYYESSNGGTIGETGFSVVRFIEEKTAVDENTGEIVATYDLVENNFYQEGAHESKQSQVESFLTLGDAKNEMISETVSDIFAYNSNPFTLSSSTYSTYRSGDVIYCSRTSSTSTSTENYRYPGDSEKEPTVYTLYSYLAKIEKNDQFGYYLAECSLAINEYLLTDLDLKPLSKPYVISQTISTVTLNYDSKENYEDNLVAYEDEYEDISVIAYLYQIDETITTITTTSFSYIELFDEDGGAFYSSIINVSEKAELLVAILDFDTSIVEYAGYDSINKITSRYPYINPSSENIDPTTTAISLSAGQYYVEARLSTPTTIDYINISYIY